MGELGRPYRIGGKSTVVEYRGRPIRTSSKVLRKKMFAKGAGSRGPG